MTLYRMNQVLEQGVGVGLGFCVYLQTTRVPLITKTKATCIIMYEINK